MHPFILMGLSIVGLLAVTIFISQSQKHDASIELQRQKHSVEVKKFDQDFSNFLESGTVEKPSSDELNNEIEKLHKLEAKKAAIDAETEKKLAELGKSIDELAKE